MKTKMTFIMATALLLAACGQDVDKIGKASTKFNMLGKNDRIEIEAFDDPDVKGLSCFLSYAKKGGLKETVNLEEDTSDASVSCVQTAPNVEFYESVVAKPRKVFKRDASFAFKSLQIMRYYDPKRKAFAYMVYSDKIIQGSPKNSLTAWACMGGANGHGATAAAKPSEAFATANTATATTATATATSIDTNTVPEAETAELNINTAPAANASNSQQYGACVIRTAK